MFANKTGANKAAVERCLDANNPLLQVVRKEKSTDFVELTPAGFAEVVADLSPERVGELAPRFARALPPAQRVSFIADLARRTPVALSELLTSMLDAARAEAAELATAAAKRRDTEAAFFRQLLEVRRADCVRLEQEVADARRSVRALEGLVEGGSADAGAPPVAPVAEPLLPVVPPSAGSVTATPTSAEDFDFRRQAARRLVSSWVEACQLNKQEGRQFLETAIANMTAIRQIGEEGEEVPYDGSRHQADRPVRDGERVRIRRPGWTLDDERGECLLAPAQVI